MSTLHIPPKHLRAILDAIPDGIGVECDGRIVWANMGFARLYGHSDANGVLGRGLDHFVVPEDLERLAAYSTARLRGEDVPDHYRFRGLHRAGHHVEVEIFVSSYEHEGEYYVLGALRDVTERVALAQRMEQGQKLEALGTLTRGIAHDFNNLLTAVMGNVAVARERIAMGQDPGTALERAATAAEKGAQLTRQLQAFTGRQHPDIEAADPAQLVRDTVELLAHTVSPSLGISTELEPGLPAAAIPPDQLQQVLMNLALNAVDALGTRGELTLRAVCEPPGHTLRFEVEDTGPGIAPAVLPRIFEPFFTTKPVGKGTGLGLAVVFGTVSSHGGRVEVDSEPGRGTRFKIWLPASAEPSPALAEPGAPPLPLEPGERTLLVVDDDPQVRFIFQEILELGGYQVVAVDSATAAIELLERRLAAAQPIHMALVDLVMPGMDGVSCIERLHSLAPTLPVLLCTGLDRDGRLDLLPDSGSIRVMRKPVSVDKLLDEVGRQLQPE
jgi:two-component system, cell cycle sensor histidine kinase and response regulator CckA